MSAANNIIAANANWNTPASWSLARVPNNTDDCIVRGAAITVNTAAVCGSLSIGDTNAATSVTLQAGGSLNISGTSGNLTINSANNNKVMTLAAATQTVTVAGAVSCAATTGTNQITVSTGQVAFTSAGAQTWSGSACTITVTGNNAGGSLNFTGALTQSNGTITNTTAAGTLNFTGGLTKSGGTFTTLAAETINFGGNLAVSTTALTFNATSTQNFTNTATITPTVAITFGNLTINPGAGKTVTQAGNISAAGALTVTTGTLNTSTFTTGVAGNFVVNGIVSGTGAITLSGAGTNIDGTGSITNTGTLTISTGAKSVLSTANLTFAGTVAISGAVTVTNNGTVAITATGNSLTGTVAGSTWTNAANSSLTVSGTLLTVGATPGTLTANASPNTVNYAGAAQTAKTPSAGYNNLTLSGSGTKTMPGALTIGGNFTMSGSSATTAAGVMTITGKMDIGNGTSFNASTFTHPVTGDFIVNGTVSGTGQITLNGATNIDGTGSITGTGTLAITTGSKSILSTANLSIAWPIPITGAITVTNNGAITSTSATGITGTLNTSVWVNAANSSLTVSGPLLTTGATPGTLTASASPNTVNYAGAAQTVKLPSGSPARYHHLTLSGSGAKTMPGTVMTIGGDFTLSGTASATAAQALTVNGSFVLGSGTTFDASTFSHSVAGSFTNNGATFTASSSTITLNGGVAQTIGGSASTTFNNLTINSAGVSLSSVNATVSGTLTLTGGTLSVGANTLNLNGPTIAGTATNLSTTSSSNLSFGGNSLSVNMPSSVTQLNNLTINNSNGITLNSSPTINGLLTFTSGNISAGSNTVIIPAAGTVSRTSGHVIGNLQKNIATGATSRTFEIGDASAYTPVTIAFGNVGTAGNLTAKTVGAEHPDIANSAIDSAKDVNRYWVVTNSGVIFNNFSGTLNYVAGDLDASVISSTFGIGKADSCDGAQQNCTWTYPTISGTPDDSTATATGMTSFSGLAVGQRKLDNFLIEAVAGGNIGTQTQNVAFNIKITARDKNNNTVTSFTGTVDIASGCTLSSGGGTTASFVAGVLAVHSVTISNTGTCTITATRTSGSEIGTSNSFSVSEQVVSFNACERTTPRCSVGSANYDRLFTKLANLGFNLDLVALKSGGTLASGFAGSATIDLLANSTPQSVGANNCPASQTAVISLGSSTFSSGIPNAVISVTAITSAYRDVRVRVTCNSTNCPPSGVTYCSTDNFSVRPQDFTVSSNMTNAAQTGGPSLAAGADFTLTATAVAGYTGSPLLDRTASKIATHVGVGDITIRLRDSAGGSNITFPAATSGTGASSATVQYHDAGNFQVLAGGIVDSSFTSVDNPGTDCVSGSSSNSDNDSNANNGLVYGCNIANQSNSSLFGRYFPSYYVMSGTSVGAACAAGGYSYMGDAHFGLGFTISAMSQANPDAAASLKLSHYTSGYGTLASVNVAAEDGTIATDLSSNFSPSLAYNSSNWSSGDYTITGATYTFTRAGTPSGPYDSLYIAAGVSDADSAALNSLDFKLGDPTCAVSCTHKKLSASTTKVRFGRLAIANASGSPALPLVVPIEAQYWNGKSFLTNTLDVCTTISASALGSDVAMGTYSAGLNPAPNCKTAIGNGGLLTSGRRSLRLSAPTGNASGNVTLTINLAAAASGNTCTTAGAAQGTAATANLPFLRGGSAYDQNPTGRATFGVYRGSDEVIFMRENF